MLKTFGQWLAEEMSDEERADALEKSNKTSIRRKVGGKFPLPVVHKAAERFYNEGIVKPEDPAHDLGSGKYNSERDYHRSKGRKFTGSDVAANVTDDHDQGELERKNHHKLITIPNVLNTIPSGIRREVIGQAARMVHKDGHVIVNHPKEPRKHGDSDDVVKGELEDHFHSVEKLPESKSGAPVYHCRHPKR